MQRSEQVDESAPTIGAPRRVATGLHSFVGVSGNGQERFFMTPINRDVVAG